MSPDATTLSDNSPSDAWVLAMSLAQSQDAGYSETIAGGLLDKLRAGGVNANETHDGNTLFGLVLYHPSWIKPANRPNETAVIRALLDAGADLFANADRLGEVPDGPLDGACPISLLLGSGALSREFLPGIVRGLAPAQKQLLAGRQEAAPGWDPLRDAVMHNDRISMAALLEAGFDANLRMADGLLPIHAHPRACWMRGLREATHLTRTDGDTLLVEALLSTMERSLSNIGNDGILDSFLMRVAPAGDENARLRRIVALVSEGGAAWDLPLPADVALHGLRSELSMPALAMLLACTQTEVSMGVLGHALTAARASSDQDALDIWEALRLWHGDLTDAANPHDDAGIIDARRAACGTARMMAFLACGGLSSEVAVREPAALATSAATAEFLHKLRRAVCIEALVRLPQHLHDGLAAFPDSLSVRPALVSAWRRRLSGAFYEMAGEQATLRPDEAATVLAATAHPVKELEAVPSAADLLESSFQHFDAGAWAAFDEALAGLAGTCLRGGEEACRRVAARWCGYRMAAMDAARFPGGVGRVRRRV